MILGSTIAGLFDSVVPLYIAIVFGYLSVKLGVFSYVQDYPAIGNFNAKFAIPFLVFRMVANYDPYLMNLTLVEADILSKLAILFVLGVYCYFRPSHQTLALAFALFSLTSMPNSVLVGAPLLEALYPGIETDVTTLVFLQCLLWTPASILILEIHKAVYDISVSKQPPQSQISMEKPAVKGDNHDSFVADLEKAAVDYEDGYDKAKSVSVTVKEDDHEKQGIDFKGPQVTHLEAAEAPWAEENTEANVGQHTSKRRIGLQIAMTVLYKFVWSPIVVGAILAFSYSLINFKYNDGKQLPTIPKSLVNLFADCALGLSMFMIGMKTAAARKLIACGLPKAILGALVRFIGAPAIMGLFSFGLGLRGTAFRFAVMQAMVPQAAISFVLGSQYNVHSDFFSTAVWFQTAIFIPFAIALDLLLNVGS